MYKTTKYPKEIKFIHIKLFKYLNKMLLKTIREASEPFHEMLHSFMEIEHKIPFQKTNSIGFL